MNSLVLEARNIHKSYPSGEGRLEVLKGIDIRISQKEILVIIGSSGAGKSTLLHILGGLDRPDKGEVIIEGADLYRINDNRRSLIRNQRIGFVFQFFHLLPEFTALENVMLPALMYNRKKLKKRQIRQLAEGLLDDVGLSSRMAHRPSQLSGGEQQRVSMARALMNEPEIVLCDEPTGNLDSDNSRRLINLVAELNREKDITFLIVSHDETITKAADKVIKIKDGIFVK